MGAEAWMWTLLAIVLLLLAWTVWTLVRLGRLEGRVRQARATLEAQLRRRAGLAAELAREYPDALGPERARALAAAAAEARSTGQPGDREAAENALGRELRELPAELPGVPASLQADLTGTSARVALARRFYNDAVRDTQALRSRRLPRVLRLHAARPMPRFFDIDDRLGVLTGSSAGSTAADRP